MRTPEHDQEWSMFVHIYLQVMRKCDVFMSPDEVLVIKFIFDRTLAYKKRYERIPIRHFTDGIIARDGTVIKARVGISKVNLLRAVRHLIQKNFIFCNSDGDGFTNHYGITDPEDIDLNTVKEYIELHQQNELAKRIIVL